MRETPENRNLGVLEYHTPTPRQWPGGIRWLINAGPWWIVPSWRSLLLILPLAACIAALRMQPSSWKPGPVRTLTPIQWAGDCKTGLRLCPQKDAVFCVDGNGDPILWRPWDDRVLARFHCPFPLTVAWLISSGDGSKLVTELSNTELLLWDSSSGRLVHQLTLGTSPYLTSDVNDVDVAALSADGNLLAVDTWWDKTRTLWNISGAQPRKLASTKGIWISGQLLFAPDDKLLVAGDYQTPHVYLVPTLTEVQPSADELAFASYNPAVSPDGARAIDSGGSPFDGPRWIFPAASGKQAAQMLPSVGLWPSTVACFFPDNRRVAIVAGDTSAIQVNVIDVKQNVQTAAIPLPIPPGGNFGIAKIFASNNCKHLAVAYSNGQIHVFDQVAPESRWGYLGSPWFYMAAAAVAVFGYSLWRDACRQSRRSGRYYAATTLTVAGAVAILGVSLLLGAARPAPFGPDPMVGWVAIALWFPAGLCIRGGSRAWAFFSGLTLTFSAYVGFVISANCRPGEQAKVQILDRTWVLSSWTVMYACLAFCLICAAVFILLLIEGRQHRLRNVPA